MSHPLSRALKSNVSLRLGTFAFNVTIHSSVAEDADTTLKTVCTGHQGLAKLTELAAGTGKTLSAAAIRKATHPISTIRQTQTCPVCEANGEFGKARPIEDGYIAIPTAVLEAADAAEAEYSKAIVLRVHDAAEVSSAIVPSGKSYYLSVKANADLYAAIVEMIRSTPEKAYVAQWAIRSAVSPFQLVVEGNVLTLRQLAEPELVRARPENKGVAAPKDLAAAIALAAELVEPFDVTSFVRPRAQILAAFTEGQMPAPVAAVVAEQGQVLSLMDALEAAKAKKKAATKSSKKSTRVSA